MMSHNDNSTSSLFFGAGMVLGTCAAMIAMLTITSIL